jgi:hypothetical protein
MLRNRVWPRHGRRLWLFMVVVVALIASVASIAQAAEFSEGRSYVLPAGSTVEDDLYVSAETVTIDGKVLGDLIAFGGLIEVNGEVTGDLISAGGGVTVNGKVGDDVRAAGGAVTINGSVGDDLLAAGGGAAPGGFVFPINVNGRNVDPGIHLAKGASVAGDAYLVGGTGYVAGSVDGDLFTGMNQLSFAGTVGGNAELYGNTIDVADNAGVGGTLKYDTGSETMSESAGANVVPAGVAPQIIPIVRTPAAPQEEPLANRMMWWTINLGRVLLGLLALGAVLLALFPGFTNGVAGELQREPWSALGYGFLVLLLFVPLTTVLVLLAWLFWGVFPGAIAVAFFLIGAGGILWMFSPVVAGFWLGQMLLHGNSSKLLQLFIGGAIILLVARAVRWIPIVGGWIGWLVLMCSWVLAVGAIITFYRQRRTGDDAGHLQSPPAIGMHPAAT